MRRLPGCLAVLLAAGLPAQVPAGDNLVAGDVRSGTVVLLLDQDLRRTFGFTTADYGVAQDQRGSIRNLNAQLIAAASPDGDEFYVGWQPGESARVLDLGPQVQSAVRLFDRITVHDARHRLETPRAGKRLLVQQGHVYVVAIDGPKTERFVVPGDPLYVKWLVAAHVPGKSVTLRWVILNEPSGALAADGSFDVRLLPRLEWLDGTSAKERSEIEGLLAKVVAGEGVDEATARLGELGAKMLPAAVNVLCSLDRSSGSDSSAAWQLDAMLTKAIAGFDQPPHGKGFMGKPLLEQHTTMVCSWYALARQARTDPDWKTKLARFHPRVRKY